MVSGGEPLGPDYHQAGLKWHIILLTCPTPWIYSGGAKVRSGEMHCHLKVWFALKAMILGGL